MSESIKRGSKKKINLRPKLPNIGGKDGKETYEIKVVNFEKIAKAHTVKHGNDHVESCELMVIEEDNSHIQID